MSLQDIYRTFASTSARESVSSDEFAKICSNNGEEVKQEKDVLEVNSCFSNHISCLYDTSRDMLLFFQPCWQGFRWV